MFCTLKPDSLFIALFHSPDTGVARGGGNAQGARAQTSEKNAYFIKTNIYMSISYKKK